MENRNRTDQECSQKNSSIVGKKNLDNDCLYMLHMSVDYDYKYLECLSRGLDMQSDILILLIFTL